MEKIKVLLLSAVLVLTGCRDAGTQIMPTATATLAPLINPLIGIQGVSGSYSGAANDSTAGSGIFSLSFAQSGTTVSGNWGADFSGSFNGGNFSGQLVSGMLNGKALSNVTGKCSVSVTGTVSGSSLRGTYTGIGSSCLSDVGSFTSTAISMPALEEYSGSIIDSLGGNGVIDLSFVQNGVYLTGNFATNYPSTPGLGIAGRLVGVVTGSATVEFEAIPSDASKCAFLSTTTISGSIISGSYNGSYCTTGETGTFSVTHI